MRAFIWMAMLMGILLAGGVARAGTFDDAVRFYGNKDYEEAHLLLQQVLKQSPDDAQARYFDAMTLKEMGKLAEFRGAAEKLNGRHAALTPQQSETLDREFITAVYRARAFEQARTLANQFPTSHPQSQEFDRIRMIGLLATFEQGMKKAQEGKNWWVVDSDEARALSEKNWANGTRDLRTFLDNKGELGRILAADQSDISTKSQSKLFENVWKARLILGEEEQLLQEMQQAPPEVQEYFQYIRARTAFEYFPEKLDQADALLQKFMEDFPNSAWKRELQRAAWKICFNQARYLDEFHGIAGREGKSDASIASKEKSILFFNQFRKIVEQVLQEDERGLSDKDIEEIEYNYIFTFHHLGQYSDMLVKSQDLIKRHPRGSIVWGWNMIHEGIAYLQLNHTDNLQIAARIFDEVIAESIVDKSTNHHLPTWALRWRGVVASCMNDTETLKQIVKKIKTEMPENKYKSRALEELESYVKYSDTATQ